MQYIRIDVRMILRDTTTTLTIVNTGKKTKIIRPVFISLLLWLRVLMVLDCGKTDDKDYRALLRFYIGKAQMKVGDDKLLKIRNCHVTGRFY